VSSSAGLRGLIRPSMSGRATCDTYADPTSDDFELALDVVLPALTRAADHALLWLAISGGLLATPRRQAHQAARRGVACLAGASLLANQVGKRAVPRTRPSQHLVPIRRRAARLPTSSSFPSGHAASAAAFAVAAGSAERALLVPLVGLAAAVAYSRVYTGVHYPSDVVAGAALGVAVAAIATRVAPVRTRDPVRVLVPHEDPQPLRPRGEGVVAVINPHAGGGRGARLLKQVTRELPLARTVPLPAGGELVDVLREAAAQAQVLAVGGGDGSVSAAARVAVETGLPLLVLPGGTLNHFAADLGLRGAADAIGALRAGSAIRVDVGTVRSADGGLCQVFVNTASLGSYPSFVAARQRWESRLGKALAAVLAIHVVLRDEQPLAAVVNDKRVLLAMMFIGNGRYQPHGFAPAWRPRLDDGLLDVRMVETSRPFAAIRLLVSLATGRLGHSRLYAEAAAVGLHVQLPDGPTPLAWDGEFGPGSADLRFGIEPRALTVYRPARRWL